MNSHPSTDGPLSIFCLSAPDRSLCTNIAIRLGNTLAAEEDSTPIRQDKADSLCALAIESTIEATSPTINPLFTCVGPSRLNIPSPAHTLPTIQHGLSTWWHSASRPISELASSTTGPYTPRSRHEPDYGSVKLSADISQLA